MTTTWRVRRYGQIGQFLGKVIADSAAMPFKPPFKILTHYIVRVGEKP
jgi:hypothetical protein